MTYPRQSGAADMAAELARASEEATAALDPFVVAAEEAIRKARHATPADTALLDDVDRAVRRAEIAFALTKTYVRLFVETYGENRERVALVMRDLDYTESDIDDTFGQWWNDQGRDAFYAELRRILNVELVSRIAAGTNDVAET